MKRIPVKLDSQAITALAPNAVLPLVMTCRHIRYRATGVSAARADRDKGALSIEMAMLVIALIAAAVLVVIAIGSLVQTKATQIGTTDTSGQ
jgi:Flp pilus assembly protein TadG